MKHQFQDYQEQHLKIATYDLNGTTSLLSLDIEDAGQLIFDFVDIQDNTENHDFIDFMS